MAGLLDAYPGLSANIDLNQLVRPPDPLGAALGEISQRLAVAGQASRLPVSTLGAIGSALGGASTAAQTAQTQYLDQAIKLQALKRSLQQMGITQQAMDYVLKQWAQAGGGAASGAPAVPAAAPGAPAAAPGAPAAAVPAVPPLLSGNVGAGGEYGVGQSPPPAEPDYIIDSQGNRVIRPSSSQQNMTGLLGGGAGAAAMPASFRLASLVGPAAGDGSGAGSDPLGLIAKYESGGRNIRQQVVPESESSASGPWQMLDSTFHETAKKAGIDTSAYKSAEDAPIETQRAVAQALYNEKGFAPWANYNPRLAAATGGGTPTGGTASPVSTLRGLLAGSDGGSSDPLAGLLALARGSGGADEDPLAGLLKPQDEVIPSGGGLPAGLLQNAALVVPTSAETAPGRTEPEQTTPVDQTSPENLALTARVAQARPPLALPGVPGMPQSLPLLLAQYGGAAPAATGGPPAAGAPVAAGAPIQGAFPPLVGPGSGTIPGLGMTPAQVALLNTMFTLGGTNSPLKEFLDVYYKSPEYLRQSAQATQQGQTAVTGPAQIAIDQAKAYNDIKVGMAKDGVMIGPNGEVVPIPGYGPAMAYNRDQLEAVTNKWQTKIEDTKAKFDTVTVPILQKDNTIADTPMSRYDRDQKQQMQGNRAPQPGDIVGKPAAALPSGYEYRMGPGGTVEAGPIANTPEAAAAEALAKTRAVADRQLQVSRDIVVQNSDRLENMAKDSALPITGAGGSFLSKIPGTAANDARVLIETMRARMSLDQLNALRAASPTGGALGNVSNAEGDRLAAAMSNLDQSQTRDQFLFNLSRAKEAYIDAVHGPGAWKQLSDQPVLKVPGPGGTAAAPSTAAPPGGAPKFRYNPQTRTVEPQ